MAEHATATRERPAAGARTSASAARPSHNRQAVSRMSPVRAGATIPSLVAAPISRSLGVDLSGVRVHSTGSPMASLPNQNAIAFAYGPDIYLRAGQSPNDLPLMAHEVAHVVQQQSAPRVQLWTPSGGDRFEREARTAASAVLGGRPFTIVERTVPAVQGGVIDDVLGWVAGHATAIPGFRLFTVVIGFDPLTGQTVPRSAANIMRAVIEVMPGGWLVTAALDRYHIFDRVAGWVAQQFAVLGDIGGAIVRAIRQFGESLSGWDLLHPTAAIDRGVALVRGPISRVHDYALGLLSGIVDMVKDAILRPLDDVAKQSQGWSLLCAVLGRDPITGDPVERSPETVIGGFMRLIGHEEIWTNIKQANAVPRAYAWFQGALAGLMGFVQQIPSMFLSALRSFQLADLLDLPGVFVRLARVFGGFALRFITWAGEQTLQLLQIIFEVVAPGAMPYIRRAAGAFREIIRDPMRFVGHLIAAARLGFQNFARNFLRHLQAGLLSWLTGALPGVYIPSAVTLTEIFKFVASVLGITWDKIRGKFVRVIGEPAMRALETGFDLVTRLIHDGPVAVWDQIREQLSNLREMVIGGITSFVTETIIQRAIPQLISLFIPGAGFITAILKIYDTIMVFVRRISQIIQVVTNFIDSISAIAAGAIEGAAHRVETTLGNLLSLAINFLAGFLGLSGVSDRIKAVIERIQSAVDRALDRAVDWIVAMARRLGRFVARAFGRRDDRTQEEKQRDLQRAVAAIRPHVRPMLAREHPGVLWRARVFVWKRQYGLSDISIRSTGAVVATINPTDIIDQLVPIPNQQALAVILDEINRFFAPGRNAPTASTVALTGTGTRTSPYDVSGARGQYQAVSAVLRTPALARGERTWNVGTWRGEPVHAFTQRMPWATPGQTVVYAMNTVTGTRVPLGPYFRSSEIPGVASPILAPPGAFVSGVISGPYAGSGSLTAGSQIEFGALGRLGGARTRQEAAMAGAGLLLGHVETLRQPLSAVTIPSLLERTQHEGRTPATSLDLTMGGPVAPAQSAADTRLLMHALSRFDPQTGAPRAIDPETGRPAGAVVQDPFPGRDDRTQSAIARGGSQVRAAGQMSASIEALSQTILAGMLLDGVVFLPDAGALDLIRQRTHAYLLLHHGPQG